MAKTKRTKKELTALTALEARQNVIDKLFSDIARNIERASSNGELKTLVNLPADLPDDLHELLLETYRKAGFKIDITDSNNRRDELTISWGEL